jgi:hypothetical protein
MKFKSFMFAALAAFAFIGCDTPEPVGPNGPGGDEPTPTEAYTIQVDKATIEADGVDFATFSILDKDGNDVLVNADGSDSDMLSKTYFVFADSGKRLERKTKTFSTIKNGEYEFYATIRGERTANTVKVTVQNRAKYEKYLQKVCVYQLTATWCGYCPEMTEGLGLLRNGQYADNVIVLACHAQDDYALPWENSRNYDLGTYVCASFGGGGYPYAVYDMSFGSGQRSESMLNSYIAGQLLANPATCGVMISKATIDGVGNAEITATVKADKPGKFELGYAILADNQPGKGGSEPVYNDVVAAVSDNFIEMQEGVTLAADEEHTVTFNVSVPKLPGVAFKPADYKVVVFAHSDANGGMVDNANICTFGSSVGYALN